MTDIATRTRKVLVEISGITVIADADHLTENLRLDSLDKIELVMALEEEFGIEIPDATAEAMQTVQHVITAMQRQVQHTQPDAAE